MRVGHLVGVPFLITRVLMAVVFGVVVFGAGGFGAGTAHAAIEAYIPVVQPWTTESLQGGWVMGTRFHTNNNITFNSLGFIDLNNNHADTNYYGSDGLLGSYQVAIWRIDTFVGNAPPAPATGTLLASTTVQSGTTSPLGENLGSMFRYAPIPATTILAGQDFIVGALLPENPLDSWLVEQSSTNAVGIVGPGLGSYLVGNTLGFPNQSVGIRSVANASTQVVPEPATAGILFSLGGIALLRRRKRIATAT